MLTDASLITASTTPLVEALTGFGPPVYWVPNGSAKYGGPIARHDDQRPISLIIAASDHQQLGALGDALVELLAGNAKWAAHSQLIELWGVGPVAEVLRQKGLPHQLLPLLPMERFLPTLASLPNPVGLLPLDDSAFSRCKSAVKVLDYAMAGIPCLCADRLPYRAVILPGVSGGLCADNTAAWLHNLEQLCATASLRTAWARAARADVLAHHTLEHTAAAWHDALVRAFVGTHRPSVSWIHKATNAAADAVLTPLRSLRKANRMRLRRRQTSALPLKR